VPNWVIAPGIAIVLLALLGIYIYSYRTGKVIIFWDMEFGIKDSAEVKGGVQGLVISDIEAKCGKLYSYGTLNLGSRVYSDRGYIFTSIPTFLKEKIYILTANTDKFTEGADFLRFNVNKDVKIFIAHDDEYVQKPSWMKRFNKIYEKLEMTDIDNKTVTFSLYEKEFSKGPIVLGGNTNKQDKGDNNMYTVIISER
jgi:hypothetical protein